jgi:hypothetical protein
MVTKVFRTKSVWTEDDDAALTGAVQEWVGSFDIYKKPNLDPFTDYGKGYYTGYDPHDDLPGAPLPPTGRDIANEERRIRNIVSTLQARERPLAYPLLPYYRLVETPIPAEIEILSRQWGIYLVDYGLDLVPNGGERFAWLELSLKYISKSRAVTFALAPDTELESAAEAHVHVTLGLDPHLAFRVADVALGPNLALGGGARAGLDAGFIRKWQYRSLKARVIATGIQSSHATWRIERDDLVGGVPLRIVLLTPIGAKRLTIEVSGRFGVRKSGQWTRWHRVREAEIEPTRVHAYLVTPDPQVRVD